MGVHKTVLAKAFLADQLAGQGGGLAHGQVVADAGSRDGFLAAIGVDKHIRYGSKNVGAQLQRQGIIHQHGKLGGFRHGEAAVIENGRQARCRSALAAPSSAANAWSSANAPMAR